jgi:5'-deoxynucleotidase
MRSIREENIMEHSHQVAVIAHALALIKNKMYGGNVDVNKVVLFAQYHEVGEVITGDLPTPIKYFNPEIKSAYKDLEKNACERILNMLPEDLKDEYKQYVLYHYEEQNNLFLPNKYSHQLQLSMAVRNGYVDRKSLTILKED